jgi:broad specificity phosphatase PhoE
MLIFPLPAPLKNNIVLVRSGESYADQEHRVETNPVKKLQQNNGLTPKGREEMHDVAKRLAEMDFSPSFIWTSNTERAYESARVLAEDLQLGQNRVVPEYSFLDARAMGTFENTNDAAAWDEVHKQDELQGGKYRPPPATDGTPSESVTDVLVRANQLVSTIESMYSGENVVILAPDSDNLSVLQAALVDETPDASIAKHARFALANGGVRRLDYVVKPSELLVTGQTQAEADATFRKMKALRVAGEPIKTEPDTWLDIWKLSVDNSR